MHHQIIKSLEFFQHLLCSRFRRIRLQIVDTLLLLSVSHLFSLYNPNQFADALTVPKASLYRDLHAINQYHYLFVDIMKEVLDFFDAHGIDIRK